MENGITIDDLRKLCKDDKLKWTLHILKHIRERQIHSTEIIQCINLGEIIEEYPLDKPLLVA